jgi:hypothetical protein
MFGWFRRKPTRHIFEYHDGTRTRHADPVEAWGRFEAACGGDPQQLLRQVATTPPPGTVGAMLEAFQKAQAEAARKLADGVCVALGVKPFGEGGLTVSERVSLAVRFIDYLAGLAEQARPFESSPSPTG